LKVEVDIALAESRIVSSLTVELEETTCK